MKGPSHLGCRKLPERCGQATGTCGPHPVAGQAHVVNVAQGGDVVMGAAKISLPVSPRWAWAGAGAASWPSLGSCKRG